MQIDKSEYNSYYQTYMDYVHETDLIEALQINMQETKEFINSLNYNKTDYRYQPGKWSTAEVIGHILDTERMMAARALRISRGDNTPIPGFDENEYVASKVFEGRTLASLSEEFTTIRHASLSLFANLPEANWSMLGTANNSPISVRALAAIIVGHTRHHLKVLEERYC